MNKLSCLKSLKVLALAHNDFKRDPTIKTSGDFTLRSIVLKKLPWLERIDKGPVTVSEVNEASVYEYGAEEPIQADEEDVPTEAEWWREGTYRIIIRLRVSCQYNNSRKRHGRNIILNICSLFNLIVCASAFSTVGRNAVADAKGVPERFKLFPEHDSADDVQCDAVKFTVYQHYHTYNVSVITCILNIVYEIIDYTAILYGHRRTFIRIDYSYDNVY